MNSDEQSLKEEIAAFERLKPQLERLWDVAFPGDDRPYTSVIIPSLTLQQSELQKIPGAAFYEERLLFLLMRLRNPRSRVVYVTSQPVHPMVLEYYLQLLVGIPASHARARLTLLCAYDSSTKPLTAKILERPRLVQRIRNGMGNPAAAYLTVFNATPLERKLSVLLGIPLNAPDPQLAYWGTKSGNRKIFREAEVPFPYGHEDLRTVEDIESALHDLRQKRPGVRQALLKLNEGFSGEGNALVDFPESTDRSALREAIYKARLPFPEDGFEAYANRFGELGGIVEERIEASEVSSPSVQLRINPRGEIIMSSTHEQILGGTNGQVFLGCRFPADDAYRMHIQDLAARVAAKLIEKGIIGRLSVDFFASRQNGEQAWDVAALEINLRMGGTTHPMLALRFLTGGELDPATGLFESLDGRHKFYRASDNVQSENYRGLLPEDLIEILTVNHLDFNLRTGTGVLFHMIGAISQFGKVGMVAIGNSRDDADELFTRTIDVLDRVTAADREAASRYR